MLRAAIALAPAVQGALENPQRGLSGCTPTNRQVYDLAGGLLPGYKAKSSSQCIQTCLALYDCEFVAYSRETTDCHLISNEKARLAKADTHWETFHCPQLDHTKQRSSAPLPPLPRPTSPPWHARNWFENDHSPTSPNPAFMKRSAQSKELPEGWRPELRFDHETELVVPNNYLNSINNSCEVAKALYPKRVSIFPRPRRGKIEHTCQFNCFETMTPDSADIRECMWKCGQGYGRDKGVSFVGTVGFTHTIMCNGGDEDVKSNGRLAPINRKVISLNEQFKEDHVKYPTAFSSEYRELTITFNITSCERNIPSFPRKNYSFKNEKPYDESQESVDLIDIATKGPEAYEMDFIAGTRKITISANEIQGALRALATLDGLVEGFSTSRFFKLQAESKYVISALPNALHLNQGLDLIYGLPVAEFHIKDWPHYSVRGILLDTARSFIPMNVLLSIFEQMGRAKLNVLQWHFSDNQAFSFAPGTEMSCTSGEDPDKYKCLPVPWDEVQMQVVADSWNLTDFVHGEYCHKEDEMGEYGSCQASLGPGAVYDRTAIGTVLLFAWMEGIHVTLNMESPNGTRSWGISEAQSCSDAYNSQNYDTPYFCDDGLRHEDIDGPLSTLAILCHGIQWQKQEVCEDPPCGIINLRTDPIEGTLITMGPQTLFKATLESFQYPINWTPMNATFAGRWEEMGLPDGSDIGAIFTSCPWNADPAYLYQPGECNVPAKMVNTGDPVHVGLSSTHGAVGCLGTELAEKGLIQWVTYIGKTLQELEIPAIAYGDLWNAHPGLNLVEKLHSFIPQITDSSTLASYDRYRSLLREVQTYIWSDRKTLDLSAGLGNTVMSGIRDEEEPGVEDISAYKTFWDLFNVDPDYFADLHLPTVINNELRALGAVATYMTDNVIMSEATNRLFPRAAAVGAGLWTGRGPSRAEGAVTFQVENYVINTFDFSTLTTLDFTDELEWYKWGFDMAHRCFPTTPPKLVWCGSNGPYGDVVCTAWSKTLYDSMVYRPPDDHAARITQPLGWLSVCALGAMFF